MDMRARRTLWPAALAAAFLLLLGWHAVPALAASVDPELIAESVTEDGYYVDSYASYFKSDSDLDRLRVALEHAGRAGVVVLPAGTNAGPVLTRLLQSPKRRATYVVLTGTKLHAASTGFSRSTVNKLIVRSAKAGNPQAQTLTFLNLLNPSHGSTSGSPQKTGNLPATTADSTQPDTVSATPAAAVQKDAGKDDMLYGIGALIAAVIAAAIVIGAIVRSRRSSHAP